MLDFGAVLLVGLLTAACNRQGPSGQPSAPGRSSAQQAYLVIESEQYGGDTIVGILHVSAAEAYFEDGIRKTSLIIAAPIVGLDAAHLKAEAAQSVRASAGKMVHARGDLQGSILWDATVVLD